MILRSSIIYGPHPLQAVKRPLFLEFVAERLCDGIPTRFFTDEFRNPVFVKDIVAVVLKLLAEPLELPRRCMQPTLPSTPRVPWYSMRSSSKFGSQLGGVGVHHAAACRHEALSLWSRYCQLMQRANGALVKLQSRVVQ